MSVSRIKPSLDRRRGCTGRFPEGYNSMAGCLVAIVGNGQDGCVDFVSRFVCNTYNAPIRMGIDKLEYITASRRKSCAGHLDRMAKRHLCMFISCLCICREGATKNPSTTTAAMPNNLLFIVFSYSRFSSLSSLRSTIPFDHHHSRRLHSPLMI